jgi:SAM-dependent methyltransferase
MRLPFVVKVLKSLIRKNILVPEFHSVLAICADSSERALFDSLAVKNVHAVGFSAQSSPNESWSEKSIHQDAMNLDFPSSSFDWGFVSDGLHHCSSPHEALLELYRISRLGIIVFESRDNLLQRLAEILLWPSQSYEISAVQANQYRSGGVNNTSVPNYIYRWTEREFKKTISSYNPTGPHKYHFYYGLNLPVRYPIVSALSSLVLKPLTLLLPQQSNSFCMISLKPTETYPWICDSSQ